MTVYSAGATGNVAPIQTIAGSMTGLHYPGGIALNPLNGNIYVANPANGAPRQGDNLPTGFERQRPANRYHQRQAHGTGFSWRTLLGWKRQNLRSEFCWR